MSSEALDPEIIVEPQESIIEPQEVEHIENEVEEVNLTPKPQPPEFEPRVFNRNGRGSRPTNSDYIAFAAFESDDVDSKTYKDAMNSPLHREWQKAMDRELNSIKETETWKEITIPDN